MTETLMHLEPSSLHTDGLDYSFPFQELGVQETCPKAEHLYLTVCLLEIIAGLSQNSREPHSFFLLNYRKAYKGVT